ncbi:MAG TPA: class I SAM-dependent methyltransferase [Gemmatimonadales bacterium]|nr:class I SAM-dependent methyltransferase [Gemmatimonadales bacterium]
MSRAEEARVRDVYARRATGDRYAYSNPAHLFMMQERERATLALLARECLLPLAGRSVLEVGCGGGQWLQDLVRWGAEPHRVHGVDLLRERVAQARGVSAPGVSVLQGGGSTLPFAAAAFDLVLQATVFSSILDPAVRREMAGEMARVLRPGGALLWYDLRVNNPRNPDVRRITREELAALFPGWASTLDRVTLAPPITRVVAARSAMAAQLLATLPWLRTHYLGVLRKP